MNQWTRKTSLNVDPYKYTNLWQRGTGNTIAQSLYIVELAIWGPLPLNINFRVSLLIVTNNLLG